MTLAPADGRARVRPIDLMVIGAPKAGTTSLKDCLGQHPDVRTHEQREMHFRLGPDMFARDYADSFATYFPGEVRERALVAKSVKLMYSALACRQLREHNPDMRVVVQLRDPVERAYSDFWFARRHGLEELETFDAALEREWGREYEPLTELPGTAYLQRSRYVPYVEHALATFGPERTHIFVLEEDFRPDPAALCGRIFRLFDGIDPGFRPIPVRQNRAAVTRSGRFSRWLRKRKPAAVRKAVHRVLGRRGTQRLKARLDRMNQRPIETPPMADDIRDRLVEHFRPCNARLAELIGRDLAAWSGGAPRER